MLIGIELDGLDQQLIHLIGYIDNRPVATARINLNDTKTKAKIQRVAVIKEHRGQGLGFELMEEIERWARKTNPSIEVLSLSAQDSAIPFYEKLNYTITNEKAIWMPTSLIMTWKNNSIKKRPFDCFKIVKGSFVMYCFK